MTPSPAMSLESTLARAVDRYGLGLLRDPDQLKLQLELADPDAPGAIAQILAALADGIPQSQLVANENGELENLLRGQVDRLVARTGVDRTRATWIVRTWALALALPTAGLDGSPALPKRRSATVPDFASVITPLSATRRVAVAMPAIAAPAVVDLPVVAAVADTPVIPAVVDPPAIAAPPVVDPPAIAAPAVADTAASPSPSLVPEAREPVEAVARVDPIPMTGALPQQPAAVLTTNDDLPRAVGSAPHDAPVGPVAQTDAGAAPAPAAPPVAAAVRQPTPADAATRMHEPSHGPDEPAPVASPARPAVDAPAAPRSAVPTGGGAVPAPRGPVPMGRKTPLTPAPTIPLPVASARPRQRRLAIASLVAVVAIVAAVTALRPERDPRERTAEAVTPTPGPSVAVTTAAPPPPTVDATTAAPAPNAGTAPVAPVEQSSASQPVPPEAGPASPSPPAAEQAAPAAASAAAVPPTADPVALPSTPTIARVGVPRVTAGEAFRVVVEVAPGAAPVSSIERRVVSGGAGGAAESIAAARLARTASGALVLPFRAIAEPGRVVVELALVGAEGSRGEPKPVEIRVAPVSAAVVAPAACTRANCGSVAAIRELEGVTPGSVRGYTVVVRMDDRTIENVVLPTRPRLGQRMRKVGNRFVAG